jgi:ABC-type glycerol-3-phosphate transport system permease component
MLEAPVQPVQLPQAHRARMSWQGWVSSVAWLLAVVVVLIICVWPLWYMVSTSLMTNDQFFLPSLQWFPKPFTWDNVVRAWNTVPFATYYRNTFIIEFWTLLGTTISASMIAYAFARLRWPGRDFCFLILLGTIMLPQQVTVIPQYIIFRQLGWIDTWYPLIVPAFLGGSPFYIFLLRQFMRGIPWELTEAARLDGCRELRIYWSIIMPLARGALAAVAIFTFVTTWNDFINPLIYIQSDDKKTVALGLLSFTSQYGTDVTALLAAASIAVLPPILLFLFAQRYFIAGITFTGSKG